MQPANLLALLATITPITKTLAAPIIPIPDSAIRTNLPHYTGRRQNSSRLWSLGFGPGKIHNQLDGDDKSNPKFGPHKIHQGEEEFNDAKDRRSFRVGPVAAEVFGVPVGTVLDHDSPIKMDSGNTEESQSKTPLAKRKEENPAQKHIDFFDLVIDSVVKPLAYKTPEQLEDLERGVKNGTIKLPEEKEHARNYAIEKNYCMVTNHATAENMTEVEHACMRKILDVITPPKAGEEVLVQKSGKRSVDAQKLVDDAPKTTTTTMADLEKRIIFDDPVHHTVWTDPKGHIHGFPASKDSKNATGLEKRMYDPRHHPKWSNTTAVHNSTVHTSTSTNTTIVHNSTASNANATANATALEKRVYDPRHQRKWSNTTTLNAATATAINNNTTVHNATASDPTANATAPPLKKRIHDPARLLDFNFNTTIIHPDNVNVTITKEAAETNDQLLELLRILLPAKINGTAVNGTAVNGNMDAADLSGDAERLTALLGNLLPSVGKEGVEDGPVGRD